VSVAGVTLAARTAIANAVTSGGLTCRKYDTADVGAGPLATVGAPEWEMVTGPDQRYGIRSVSFLLYVYQQITSDNEVVRGYQDTNFELLVDALGADRTLGGKVTNSDFEGDPGESFAKFPNGALYSIVSARVRVWPFPNAG